jgi:hypothetical protein
VNRIASFACLLAASCATRAADVKSPPPEYEPPAPAAAAAPPSAPPTDAGSPEPEPAPEPDPAQAFAAELSRLRGADLGAAADIVEARVAQSRRKMKLELPEGLTAARALLSLLPNLPESRRLLATMPKATVELVRGISERGVPQDEAERIARYLLELHDALAMENPKPLDENTSHVICREWHEIDYRDEGMTWEKQQSIYAPRGVPNFKTEASFRTFFRIESQAPYFKKLYRPRGEAP